MPFLPVYGIGGLLVYYAAPRIEDSPMMVRAGIYGASLTLLEYGACKADRALGGRPAWDYGGGACVDVPHAATWAGLGLAVEAAARSMR